METGEVWTVIESYPHYQISTLGRVLGKNGKPLRPAPNSKGYLSVCLYGPEKRTSLLVHRLVLEAFVGPCPDGMESLHGDGNKLNNRLDNLRWGTSAANHADKFRHGTDNRSKVSRGEFHGTKLVERDVIEIRQAVAAGQSYSSLSKRYGVGGGTIREAATGISWSHLGGAVASVVTAKGDGHVRAKLNSERVRVIRRELEAGVGVGELASRFGVSFQTVWAVKRGQTWKGVS